MNKADANTSEASSGAFTRDDDVVKRGYLGKLERYHRRYFVLRDGSDAGPSRLEWYVTEEAFKMKKSAGKTLFGSNKLRVIYLRRCLGVSKTSSTRKGHTVAVYAKDYTLFMVAADPVEQEEWYWAIKRRIEKERRFEERNNEEEEGECFDEEDEGYSTIPPGVFKEVWPVTIKPRGLGRTKSLAGETCLCLSAALLLLARVASPAVTLPLLSVRCCGRSEGMFFLELGRNAPHGPGELWMGARAQGDPGLAQQIHEAVRDAMRALRLLPDFRRSPAVTVGDQQSQNQLRTQPGGEKRTGPKPREGLGPSTPTARPLAPESGRSERPAIATRRRWGSADSGGDGSAPGPGPCGSRPGSQAEAGGYVAMTSGRGRPADRRAVGVPTVTGDAACCWIAGETEGRGDAAAGRPIDGPYMTMSPRDDYVAMASPRPPPPWPDLSPGSSPPQASSNRFSSEEFNSAPYQSYRLLAGTARPEWLFPVTRRPEPEASCSEMLTATRPSGEEDVPPWGAPRSPQPAPARCPLSRARAVPAASGPRADGRFRLSSCLPSCLRPGESD